MFVMLAKMMSFSQLPAVKKTIILASIINKYSTYFVTALARFFSSEPRRPKSLLCGTKFHLQRAQEALSVEHLVASTDIFYGSFPEVAPDARRHAPPPPLLFKNTSSISDSKRGPQWLIFRQALRSFVYLERTY